MEYAQLYSRVFGEGYTGYRDVSTKVGGGGRGGGMQVGVGWGGPECRRGQRAIIDRGIATSH